MERVIFDYSIRFGNIESDKKQFNLANLSLDELKDIANGRIFLFFEPKREYIVLETSIIDYLIQFRNVIDEIDQGNSNPFSVSCDWYSNSLDYRYNPNGRLQIREVNEHLFTIEVNYSKFKTAFENFYNLTLKELSQLYPSLLENGEFLRLKS